MSIEEVLKSIAKQTEGTPRNKVYILEIESIPFKHISKELQTHFESFPALQYLALNNCGLDTLENFPKLPSLIRLDLISNNLTHDFSNLQGSKYIQTLFLSANQISDYKSLLSLSFLGNLLQLDLIANPITSKDDYVEEIFKIFPSLKFLDSKDKIGKTSHEANMSESLQRVRPDLFLRGQSLQNLNGNHSTQLESRKNGDSSTQVEIQKPDPTEKNKQNLNGIQYSKLAKNNPNKEKKAQPIKRTNSYKNKNSLLKRNSRSIATKLGLIFPIGRIRRHLRQKVDVPNLSMSGVVFLATVLEYMCAEILEAAGNKAKEHGFKRIRPKHLFEGIKLDLELKEVYEDAIIPEAEFISKLRID